MAFDPVPIYNQAVLEIRYAHGIVYLDHCGSLMVALEKTLGEPFIGSVPQMTSAELSSEQERLSVRYGKDSCSITQTWFDTLARFQMVVPKAWQEVARVLRVDGQVTRCGARYWFMWPITDRAHGEKVLNSLKLAEVSQHWTDVKLPPPRYMPVRAFWEAEGRSVRFSLDVVQQQVRGYVAKEHERFALKDAILLDLDFFSQYQAGRKLSPEDARGFAAETWDAARAIAKRIGEALEACH